MPTSMESTGIYRNEAIGDPRRGRSKPIEACEGRRDLTAGFPTRFNALAIKPNSTAEQLQVSLSSLSAGKPAKRRATRNPSLLPNQHERINNSIILRDVEMMRRNVSRTIISFAYTAARALVHETFDHLNI